MSDTAAQARFYPAVLPPTGPAEPALWFLFRGARLLVSGDGGAAVPAVATPADLGLSVVRWQYLGRLEDANGLTHCFSGEVAEETPPPSGLSFENLRALYPRLPEAVVKWRLLHPERGAP